VAALASEEKTLALAAALRGGADTDVVEIAKAQAVDGEAAAADRTGQLAHHIVAVVVADGHAEDADAGVIRPANQADGTVGPGTGSFAIGHGQVSTVGGTTGARRA